MRRLPLIGLGAALLLGACNYGTHSGHTDGADVVTFGRDGGETLTAAPATGTHGDDASTPVPPCTHTWDGRGNYAEVFNDSNYVHWAAAESIGIPPITDMRSIWELRRPLVKVESGNDFYLEELTHSYPYLVPEASAALHELGRRFSAEAREETGRDLRLRVTSVLRTVSQVRRLQRGNSNAVDSSTHLMGTTVDISYDVFIDRRDSTVSDPRLKCILAQTLYDMRREGRYWVKYERRQPCFHITARGREDARR